ncbi:MAG: response regulator transcription factor [Firmicutes bacterium]|nr:response regulator transcription factor [Bacillota bacterium]
MKLLFAEDEIAMAEAVADILTYHNYYVDTVDNGLDALAYALAEHYDGIILDIMMPGKDGLTVLKELRQQGVNTPVLLLTAKSEVADRIAGLNLGADDYLPKPFVMEELLARVRAMLRRREEYTPDVLQCGNLALSSIDKTLSGPDNSFILSKLEYQLMELLMLNQGQYFSSEKILERVWGYDTDAELGVVWVYISYLRKKMAALKASAEIKSRRGVGYTLEAK